MLEETCKRKLWVGGSPACCTGHSIFIQIKVVVNLLDWAGCSKISIGLPHHHPQLIISHFDRLGSNKSQLMRLDPVENGIFEVKGSERNFRSFHYEPLTKVKLIHTDFECTKGTLLSANLSTNTSQYKPSLTGNYLLLYVFSVGTYMVMTTFRAHFF